MNARPLIAALAAMLWVMGVWPAGAVAGAPHVDCRAPFVFDGADVNVVVLPYRSAANSSVPLGEIGQRLALLIKLDVFSHILDYGSIGAVQMEVPFNVGNDTSCDPQLVMAQLLGQHGGALKEVAQGRGVIFVWGILYEEEQDVVVQTYARFLRRDTSEAIALQAGGLDFTVQPSTATVAFAPQLFPKDRMVAIEKSFTKADVVRTQPRDDAPGQPLPHDVAKCFGCSHIPSTAFQVQQIEGEWIQVRWLSPGTDIPRSGWIHAAGRLGGESLDQVLPELSFIEGTVGYLRQRVAESRGEHLPQALSSLTARSFESFQAAEAAQASTAVAVGQQLSGLVQMLQRDEDRLLRAQRDFDAAIQLTPYDAHAVTLAAVTRIVAEWNARHAVTAEEELADRLTSAVMLSEQPAAAVSNLRNFYKLLQTRTAVGAARLSSAEVAQRLHDVELIRLAGPSP